jgi:hypothetical protein
MAIIGVKFHGCGASLAHAATTNIAIHKRFEIPITESPIAIVVLLCSR